MTLPANADSNSLPAAPEDDGGGSIFTRYRLTQFLVVVASIICFGLFWYGGKWTGIPADRGFEDSLLQQPNWPLGLFAIYIMLLAAIVIGTLIAGRFWFFAGLFTATAGLTALSGRGGPMRYVLFAAETRGTGQAVYLHLLLEHCLLFAPVLAAWWFFSTRYAAVIALKNSGLETAKAEDQEKRSAAIPGSWPVTIVIQCAIAIIVMLLMTPTDAKKQVLIAAFLAGFVGTALAEYFAPNSQAGKWYWIGPFVLGAMGYILAYSNFATAPAGSPGGTFAGLARALPFDYAGAGVAGTLLGYWIGADRPELAVSILSGTTVGVIFKRRRVVVSNPSASTKADTPPPGQAS